MDLGLQGKTALVTGGAKGIGSGISEVFAQEGANVAILYHSDAQACEAFAVRLAEQYGVHTWAMATDVGVEAEVEQAFQAAEQEFGSLDILVNNAGYCPTCAIDEMDLEMWEYTLRTNLTGLFLLSRAMVRHLRQAERPGAIINILSKAAISAATPGRTAYNASKAGGVGFTKTLAREVTGYGIRVNGVLPGMVTSSKPIEHYGRGKEEFAKRLATIPIGKAGRPSDIANMVAMLASDKSEFAIGSIVDMTGGMLL